MAVLDFFIVFFGCWTAAYQITLASRVPSILLYVVFLLLFVPSLIIERKMRAAAVNNDRGGMPVYAGIFAISMLVAVMSMVIARPDWDDLGYFHRAFVQFNHLKEPFYVTDTMHNVPGLALTSPVGLLSSYEMFAVFSAKLLGLDPVMFYHNISSAAAAALVPVVYYLLYRESGAGRWTAFAAMAAAVSFLWLDGNRHHSFGDMAFVRLFQGKAVFFTLGVPLLFLYLFRYVKDPSRENWLKLCFAGLCGIGLTSSALFLEPVLFFVFSMANFANRLFERGREPRVLFREVLAINLAGLYPLFLLFFLRVAPIPSSFHPDGDTWWRSVQAVIGGGWSLVEVGLLLFAVPWLALDRSRARFWLIYIVILTVVCFNPVTGPVLFDAILVYSRLVYLLPLPLFAGLGVVIFAALLKRTEHKALWRAGYAVLLMLVVSGYLAFGYPSFAQINMVHYKRPFECKFDVKEYRFCKAVSESLAGRSLLAPEKIVVVAPLMNDSVRLETARKFYTMDYFVKAGKKDEAIRRIKAQDFVETGMTRSGEAEAFSASVTNGVDAVIARKVCMRPVLDRLSSLPGRWVLFYQDEDYGLIIKTRV